MHGFGQFRLLSEVGVKYRLRTNLRNKTAEARILPAVTTVDVSLI